MSDVNVLAALIREVDGSHDLGAGALAEALMERGVAVVPDLLAALAEAEARADELVEQYRIAAPYYPMYYDERRSREAAESALTQLREQIAAALQSCPTSFNNEADEYGAAWADGAVAALRHFSERLSPSTVTPRCPWCDEPVETPGSVLNSEHVSESSHWSDGYCDQARRVVARSPGPSPAATPAEPEEQR